MEVCLWSEMHGIYTKMHIWSKNIFYPFPESVFEMSRLHSNPSKAALEILDKSRDSAKSHRSFY